MKIIICMAQTTDGKIAKSRDHLVDWTSKEDKKHFINLTKKHQVIIMGETTYKTIDRPLPGRLNFILTKDPDKFSKKVKKGELEFFFGTPKKIISHLKKRGYKSTILGGGSYTNASFLNAGLVDEVVLTHEGLLFGKGFGFCEGLEKDIKLEIINADILSESTFVMHYKVIK